MDFSLNSKECQQMAKQFTLWKLHTGWLETETSQFYLGSLWAAGTDFSALWNGKYVSQPSLNTG